MPSDTYPYAVFGFSENLDWSTIHFVNPIDDIRVCNACRVVARKAAFLPCRHVLCEPCFEQWKPRVKVCFLDGELCPENEVYWREFPLERMMKNQASCWNKENGCTTITEVSSLAEHFHRDCAYHSTCCTKCSSTVLRKNIVAHLESQCATHVLSRKRTGPPVDGVSKELVEVRKGLLGIGMALRSYTHTNSLVPSTLQATQASQQDNLNSLLTMAAEVKQVSLLTEEALSLVKANRETSVNQAVHLKTAEASLSVELDKIANAAMEWSRCETSANRENAELEEHLGKLTLLRREIEVVSSRLGEFRDKVYPEAAIAASAVAGGLSEARVSKVVVHDEGEFSERVTARVFEDALKVPVKALCSVRRRSTSTLTDDESMQWRPAVEIGVDDNRYRILMLIQTNTPFQIYVCMLEKMSGALAKSPRKLKLKFTDERKDHVGYESDNIGEEMEDIIIRTIRRCFVRTRTCEASPHRSGTLWHLWHFDIENPEECLRIDRDQLRMCLTFSY